MLFQTICIAFFCTPDDRLGKTYLIYEGTEGLGLMYKGRTLTHTGSWILIVLPCLLQQLPQTLRGIAVEVCHFITFWNVLKCEKNKQIKGRKGWILTLYVWCNCGTSTYCEGERGIVEGGPDRTAHLVYLLWVNLFTCGELCIVSPQKNCNLWFYYFWANPSGIVLKSLLFLIQLIDGFLFWFNGYFL